MRLSVLSEALKEFTVGPNRHDLEPGIKWIADNYPDIYDAHTLGKGAYQDLFPILDYLFTKGVDPERPFHTGVITTPNVGMAAGLGGSMYGPFTSGWCMLISYPNDMLEQRDGSCKIKAILTSDILKNKIGEMESRYKVPILTNDTIAQL